MKAILTKRSLHKYSVGVGVHLIFCFFVHMTPKSQFKSRGCLRRLWIRAATERTMTVVVFQGLATTQPMRCAYRYIVSSANGRQYAASSDKKTQT